jgi:hypothetical protein
VTTFSVFSQNMRADSPNLRFADSLKPTYPGKIFCAIDDFGVYGYNRNEKAA